MDLKISFGNSFFLLTLAVLCSSNQISSIGSTELSETFSCSTPLHEAVSRGSPPDVDNLIQNGTNVYVLDCNGLSALHLAVQINKLDMIFPLVKNGFDVNMQFENGDSVIFYAVRLGNIEAVKTLIKFGSNVSMVDLQGSTPLIEAMLLNETEIVNLLEEYNASCTMKLANGDTVIHRAAEIGNVSLILSLIDQYGLKCDELNDRMETPLTKAVMHNHPPVINILFARGANLSVTNHHGETLPYLAVTSKSLDSLRALMELGMLPEIENLDGWSTPLLASAKINFRAAADMLIYYRADIQRTNSKHDDNNILHFAAREGYADAIPWLADLGLSVNSINSERQMPLHLAAIYDQLKVAEILLNLSACLNCRDSSNRTPYGLSHTKSMDKFLHERGGEL